jgi:Ni,Fe-hydrogenase maturation factor
MKTLRQKKKWENISTHEGDIVKLVELGIELEYPVPEIQILAIEPESLDMDMALSECLQSKLGKYVSKAIDAVKN